MNTLSFPDLACKIQVDQLLRRRRVFRQQGSQQ
jgi:hypothetical protein